MLIAKDVTYSYTAGADALSGVSFTLEYGRRVGLVGCNGAGKSTLLSILCGLLLPGGGQVSVDGVALGKSSLTQIRSLVGMVFQNPDDQLFMPTVYDDVAFGLRHRRESEEAVRHRVEHTLEHFGILELASRPPYRLSGGEKRSAALAAVVAMQPRYVLYDEPGAFLDRRAKGALMELIPTITAGQLIASHDFDLIEATCDRVLILHNGKILADGPPDVLLHDTALLREAGLYLGGEIKMHEHHGHEHSHGIQTMEETVATLGYMLRHNEHHADELRDLAHSLEHLEKPEAAAEVRRCIEDYEKGNRRLAEVLAGVKGE